MRSSHRVSQQPPRNALQRRNSAARSSAVGSAPRSGRGGRAFESPLLDKKGQGCPFFVMVMYAESPINHLRITYESPKNH